jgi:pimeloyl-ACP methyl ester carboxylesterase
VAINGSHFAPIEEAYEPQSFKQFKRLPANFAPRLLKGPYDRVVPDPTQWPVLVAKVKKMGLEWKGFTREQMKSIKAPVLITLGDRDGVKLEHAVEMFRLVPNAKLAVFPGGDPSGPQFVFRILARTWGETVSQKRTVWSPEHETSRVPSGLQASAWT